MDLSTLEPSACVVRGCLHDLHCYWYRVVDAPRKFPNATTRVACDLFVDLVFRECLRDRQRPQVQKRDVGRVEFDRPARVLPGIAPTAYRPEERPGTIGPDTFPNLRGREIVWLNAVASGVRFPQPGTPEGPEWIPTAQVEAC